MIIPETIEVTVPVLPLITGLVVPTAFVAFTAALARLVDLVR